MDETIPAPSRATDPPRVIIMPAPLSEANPDERYEERSLLGEGGMGTVLLCRDSRVGRDVAIKKIRGGNEALPSTIERFVREARVQGQLEHPAVVPVYDLGCTAKSEPFFTMRRVRGVTLEDVLAHLQAGDPETTAKFGRHRLLAAFVQLCLALHYAHVRGVLHRDLKPANVMFGDFGEVYVLDWGLARMADEPESAPNDQLGDSAPPFAEASHAQTLDGDVFGTPGYMAPEQARGEHSALDERADVYALGAILFEILTFEQLHRGDTIAELLASTLRGEVHPVSESLRTHGAPPELEATCLSAIALNRDERQRTAALLHNEIQRYLEGDRDTERRRTLADEHATEAEAAVERALGARGTLDDRGAAMRAAGRALVLDPEHERAARAMLRLLAEPPRELPPEARSRMDNAVEASTRVMARRGTIAYIAWIATAPVTLLMGVRNWSGYLATMALLVGAAVFSALRARPGGFQRLALPLAFACGSAALTLSAFVLGPFILGPSVGVAHTMMYALLPGRRWRAIVLASGSAAMVGPWVAERAGWLPPSVVFEDGTMHILPRFFELPPTLTPVLILLTSVSALLIAAVFIMRYRDALRDAEEQLHLYTWHLSHLVPNDARR